MDCTNRLSEGSKPVLTNNWVSDSVLLQYSFVRELYIRLLSISAEETAWMRWNY
jgi:hypothetical protein